MSYPAKSSATAEPTARRAASNSYRCCRFIQNSGVGEKHRANRNAVSAVMPRRSLAISLTRGRHTKTLGKRIGREPKRLHKLFAQDLSRMDRRQ